MKKLDFTNDNAFEASLIRCITLDSTPVLERIHLMDNMFQALEEKPDSAALVYELPGWEKPSFRLIGDSLVVGREPQGAPGGNFLGFPDHSSLSRNHFRILRDQGVFILEDEGSRNGTFVNSDEQRTKQYLLKSGDFIYAGGVLFSFIGDLYHDTEED